MTYVGVLLGSHSGGFFDCRGLWLLFGRSRSLCSRGLVRRDASPGFSGDGFRGGRHL